MSTRANLRDAEIQKRPKYLCVSESLWLVAVIVVAMMVTVAAQIRPTPQAPPRRTAPPPKTAPQPKRESPEPEEKKGPDRGPEGSAPQPQGSAPQASALQASTDPNVNAGAALYRKNGCYECHVNDAQGGPQGPRLGPNPIPLPRFVAYVRNPSGDMPPFTAKVISDDDLSKIYAFLQSRSTPPAVKDIPLLAP
jgi:mono/diheme cytochrome c family protein